MTSAASLRRDAAGKVWRKKYGRVIFNSRDAEAVADTVVSEVTVGEETVPKKKQRKPINQQKLQDNLWGWIFCIPLIVGTVWFVYSALIMSLILSFTDYTLGDVSLWEALSRIGNEAYMYKEAVEAYDEFNMPIAGESVPNFFGWYKFAFTNQLGNDFGYMNEMGAYLFNTVFYMIGIPIGMFLAMFFAVCMSRDIKGGNLFRVLYYIPCVASTIAVVYTFRIMFSDSGVINSLFGSKVQWMATSKQTWASMLNIENAEEGFLTNPFWCQGIISKCVIVIMSVWKGLGGTIILYVAGLSGVNAATKEAAQIDGANSWQIFWKVTMPDLYPTIFYNLVTSVIGGMQIYTEPVLLFGENALFSPLTSGYVSLIYIHGKSVFEQGGSINPSAGAAYGMILAVMIFFMTLFQFWLDSRKKD